MPNKKKHLLFSIMRDEGKYLLEWVAYHTLIGFDDLLIASNNSDPAFITMCDRLQEMGWIHHLNVHIPKGQAPQRIAVQVIKELPVYKAADWVMLMDADEFLNIKIGDKRIHDLTDRLAPANTISVTWRFFGSMGLSRFDDGLTIETFTKCAPEFVPSPKESWAFKTLFSPKQWGRIGIHRPKEPVNREEINWVNASGVALEDKMIDGGWRTGRRRYSYEFAQVNHYALRSKEDFIGKQLRGRGAHVGSSIGDKYWKMADRNDCDETSITWAVPKLREMVGEMLKDKVIKQSYEQSLRDFKAKVSKHVE